VNNSSTFLKKQETDAIGHCRITPLTLYFAALKTTGKVPRLNPHKIIEVIGFFSQAHAITIYRSPQIIYYPTTYFLLSPYAV
jgi:hypothetical protein